MWQLVPCSSVIRLRYLSSPQDFDNCDQNNSFLLSSVHDTLSQNEFFFSLGCLTNFNIASLFRFNRWGVFFDQRDFRLLHSISLHCSLVTLHPDECKSSCSSSREIIGFCLIRRPNVLDHLRAPDRFVFFFFKFIMSFKPCNVWTYRSKRNIQVAWDISIIFSTFPKLNNQCFSWITQFFARCHDQILLARQAIAESSG